MRPVIADTLCSQLEIERKHAELNALRRQREAASDTVHLSAMPTAFTAANEVLSSIDALLFCCQRAPTPEERLGSTTDLGRSSHSLGESAHEEEEVLMPSALSTLTNPVSFPFRCRGSVMSLKPCTSSATSSRPKSLWLNGMPGRRSTPFISPTWRLKRPTLWRQRQRTHDSLGPFSPHRRLTRMPTRLGNARG